MSCRSARKSTHSRRLHRLRLIRYIRHHIPSPSRPIATNWERRQNLRPAYRHLAILIAPFRPRSSLLRRLDIAKRLLTRQETIRPAAAGVQPRLLGQLPLSARPNSPPPDSPYNHLRILTGQNKPHGPHLPLPRPPLRHQPLQDGGRRHPPLRQDQTASAPVSTPLTL